MLYLFYLKSKVLILKVFQYFVLFVAFFTLLSSCHNFIGGAVNTQKNCRLYQYDPEKNIFMDSSGNPVLCSIVDNERIFDYHPQLKCDPWIKHFQSDPTVTFNEIPIKIGVGDSAIVTKYCVKQRYIGLDNTGQVLLIDEGAFCLQETSVKQEFQFSSCEGVTRAPATNE